MVPSGIGGNQAGRGDPYDVGRGPLAPLPVANEPDRASRDLSTSVGSSQLIEPTDGATGLVRALRLRVHPGSDLVAPRADPIDQPDRSTTSILEVPITWLGLTSPSGPLHLKMGDAQEAYAAQIWSSGSSLHDQMAWAHEQGA